MVAGMSRSNYLCILVNQPAFITLMNMIRESVRVVENGLQNRLKRESIINNLRTLGIPQQFLEDTYLTIESGLKNGVNAAVTDGLSAQDYKPGKSELYDAAFEEGKRAFKNHVRSTWLRRFAITLAITFALVWLVLHFL
jgi:hypothetical protein